MFHSSNGKGEENKQEEKLGFSVLKMGGGFGAREKEREKKKTLCEKR